MAASIEARALDDARVSATAAAACASLRKYETMRRIGLEAAAIRQKMECDGVEAEQIDAFFV